jgi:hypothetical protein
MRLRLFDRCGDCAAQRYLRGALSMTHPLSKALRFRKKPVVIEAVQWWPDEALGFFDEAGKYQNRRIGTDAHGVEYTVCDVGIQTLEGLMHIKPGDWIITGVKGERYPCKPDIFAATYEAADALDARVTTEAEWQDISTAPKDGTQLMVWQPQPFDTTHDGVKMARSPAGPYNAHWDVMDGAWCLSGGTWVGPFLEPTHWMPLPRKPGEPK